MLDGIIVEGRLERLKLELCESDVAWGNIFQRAQTFRGGSFTRKRRKENTPYAATNTVIQIEFLYWLLGVVVMTEGRRTLCL